MLWPQPSIDRQPSKRNHPLTFNRAPVQVHERWRACCAVLAAVRQQDDGLELRRYLCKYYITDRLLYIKCVCPRCAALATWLLLSTWLRWRTLNFAEWHCKMCDAQQQRRGQGHVGNVLVMRRSHVHIHMVKNVLVPIA